MLKVRTRRYRDPVATRESILHAARVLLARDGPEAMSLSAVAVLAGVNRGTAYQHFVTREQLVSATVESVSDLLFRAAFGDPATIRERRFNDVDITSLTMTLADFAVDNPALCRIWFLQVLASEEPDQDPFWREYAGSLRSFTGSDLVEPGIDSDVFSLLMLAGNFLWPVWARTHEKSEAERRVLAQRFARETLRLAMYGTMRIECFPGVEKLLAGPVRVSAPPACENALR